MPSSKHSVRVRFRVPAGLPVLAVIAVLFAFVPAHVAQAQNIGPARTVYCIQNIDGFMTFPLAAYTVNDDQLILAGTFSPQHHGIGPVGLALDTTNKRLFITFEGEGFVDVYNAADATPLGTIHLLIDGNLAGTDVREATSELYVVNRSALDVFIYDSMTLQPVDRWLLPSGNGAWGIDLVENFKETDGDVHDVLFIGDLSKTVRWYDLDTREESGSVVVTKDAIAVIVDNSGEEKLLYFTANHSPTDSQFLSQYNLTTGEERIVDLGGGGRGIGLNPDAGYVYVGADNAGVRPATVRVFDKNDMTEISSVDVRSCGGGDCSPTDVEASAVAFGSTVKKEIVNESINPQNRHGVFEKGENIIFKITLMNKGLKDIHVLPLKDVYDTTQLTYVSADIAPVDTVDDGEIDWTDIISAPNGVGHDLAFEESFSFQVTFLAEPENCDQFVQGVNIMQSVGVLDVEGAPIDDAAGSVDYKIWCTCLVDADCPDDGVFCNGGEICYSRVCTHKGNPCPVDDGLFCNGEETLVCNEETKDCGHTGPPCQSDGDFCNGEEICDAEQQRCLHSGNPCADDGLFCNGDEFCEPGKTECSHTGDPCAQDETCDEPTDRCLSGDAPTGPSKTDPGWPHGKVTGGCCGCG